MVEIKNAVDKSSFWRSVDSTDAVWVYSDTRRTRKRNNNSEFDTTVSNKGRFVRGEVK